MTTDYFKHLSQTTNLYQSLSLTGFVNYVHPQPVARPINHLCWESCAVGDYIQSNSSSNNSLRTTEERLTDRFHITCARFSSYLFEVSPSLWKLLSTRDCYGDLFEYGLLSQRFKQLVEEGTLEPTGTASFDEWMSAKRDRISYKKRSPAYDTRDVCYGQVMILHDEVVYNTVSDEDFNRIRIISDLVMSDMIEIDRVEMDCIEPEQVEQPRQTASRDDTVDSILDIRNLLQRPVDMLSTAFHRGRSNYRGRSRSIRDKRQEIRQQEECEEAA